MADADTVNGYVLDWPPAALRGRSQRLGRKGAPFRPNLAFQRRKVAGDEYIMRMAAAGPGNSHYGHFTDPSGRKIPWAARALRARAMPGKAGPASGSRLHASSSLCPPAERPGHHSGENRSVSYS